MKTVYLDNAATTKIDENVIDVVCASMKKNIGNPSSIHQYGRTAKSAIETARKNIAKHFNVTASEIIFTSGGTEADNLILQNAVLNLGVKRIITSKIEHHAVLNFCKNIEISHGIILDYVNLDDKGSVNLVHLEELLSNSKQKTLVSLMHVNNEIGTILDLDKVSKLCVNYNALFHSDTVQSVAHYAIDLQKTPVDFIVASAHKFHGPKGVGFAYFKKGVGIMPMLYGGDQEKGARSGTENVHGILGLEKALTIAFSNLEVDKNHIQTVKNYFISELKKTSTEIIFNGESSNLEKSSYTILNVRFPLINDLLLFTLDLAGVAVSGGSACQSGSNKGSHVLSAFLNEKEAEKTSIRFSFSKYTSKEDINFTLAKIKDLL